MLLKLIATLNSVFMIVLTSHNLPYPTHLPSHLPTCNSGLKLVHIPELKSSQQIMQYLSIIGKNKSTIEQSLVTNRSYAGHKQVNAGHKQVMCGSQVGHMRVTPRLLCGSVISGSSRSTGMTHSQTLREYEILVIYICVLQV